MGLVSPNRCGVGRANVLLVCMGSGDVMRLLDQRWRVAGMMVDCLCSPGRSLGTRSGSRRCWTRVDRIGLGIAVGRS